MNNIQPKLLLSEQLSFDQAKMQVESLESTTGREGKDLYLSGVFVQGNVRNGNGRIYPDKEIEHAVQDIMGRISSGYTVLGECDHPEKLDINLDRVSHMIEKMWVQGSSGCGKLKIVGTPMGKLIQALVESGAKLGVSSRGSGNLDNSGYVSEFEIITVDIVANPSAPNAYPKAIYESLLNMNTGGQQIYGLAEDAVYDNKAMHHLCHNIKAFINELNK